MCRECAQLLRRGDPPRGDICGTLRNLYIPWQELVGRCQTLTDILQYRIPLAEDVRIAQEFPVVRGACLRELCIQITAAERRRTLDKKEILGRKEYHRQDADKVSLPQILSAALDAPPCTACERKGKLRGNIVSQEGKPNMRPICAHTNELRIARCAMGATKRGIVKCLDDIRLALCIRSEENLHARIESEV